MEALLKISGFKINGFLCPGHVSVIIGSKVYQKLKVHPVKSRLCRDTFGVFNGVHQVISGFEMEDILISVYFYY